MAGKAVKLAEAYVQIVPSMKGVGKAITDAFDKSSSSAGKSAGITAGIGFSGGLKAKMGAAIGVASSIAGKAMDTIGSSINSALNRADQMNNFPKVMKNLGYSSEDAAKSVRKISESLDGLPTTSSAMTGMVQQLAPLTSNLDEATTISLAFNNAMLAGGASTTEQENALAQYCQMLAAGKVDMAAWRSIQAAMPGQLNQVAESMLGAGKNANDLYEEMKDGKIGFDQFNAAVVKLNRDGFGQYASFTQQAKDATQGIGTAVENVKNRVAKAVQKVIEAFGVEQIATAINTFSSQFGKIGTAAADMVTYAKSQAKILYDYLKDWGALDTLQETWTSLVDTIKNIDWNGILPTGVWDGFRNTAGSALADLAVFLSYLVEGIEQAIKWVCDFASSFAATGAYQAWIDVFCSVLDVLAVGRDMIVAVICRIGELFNSAGGASGFGESIGNAFKTIAGLVKPLLDKLVDLLNWFTSNPDIIITALGAIGGAFAAVKGYQALTNGLKTLTGAMDAVTNGVKDFKAGFELIRESGGIVSTIKNLGSELGIVKSAQAAWNAVTTAAKAVWGAFNAVLSANPIGLIITLIAAVVGALVWFFTQTDTGRRIWASFMDWLRNAWQTICDFAITLWQGLCDFFTGLWDGIKSTAQNVWNAISDFFVGLWSGVKSAWDTVWNGIKTAFEFVWGMIQAYVQNVIMPIAEFIKNVFIVLAAVLVTIWNWIKTGWETVWNAIVTFFTPIIQGIQTAISAACTFISETWNTAWTAVCGFFQSVWNAIVAFLTPIIQGIHDTISSVVNSIKATWDSIWSGISSFFSGVWNGMKEAAANAINTIAEKVRGIKDTVMSALSGAGEWLRYTGRNLIQGLINGIGDMFGWVKDKICNLGSNVLGWAEKVLGIGSPSRIFRQYGEWLDEGLAIGITQSTGDVQNAIDGMTGMVAATSFSLKPDLDPQIGAYNADIMRHWEPYTGEKANNTETASRTYNIYANDPDLVVAKIDARETRANAGWGGA